MNDLGQSLYRHEMLSKNGLTKEANAEIGKIKELANAMNLCYNPIKRTEQAQKDIMILTKSSKHYDYCDKNEKLVRANIVFSLPDGDWSEEHGKYYKFAAKIFKVA